MTVSRRSLAPSAWASCISRSLTRTSRLRAASISVARACAAGVRRLGPQAQRMGLAVGRASDGAFDIGMGDAVRAWGFGPVAADEQAIRAAMAAQHPPGA